MLVTTVEKETFTRPVYVSPTAAIARLFPTTGRLEDVVHMFTDTFSQFQIVFRTMASQPMFCHEARLVDGMVEELAVERVKPTEDETDTAYVLTLPRRFVQPDAERTRRRLQLFDQERRLLFTKEWMVDTGKLHADAVSWLRDSHHPLPLLSVDAPPISAPLVYSVAMEDDQSQAVSIAGSFVDLDTDLPSRSVSRSDSIVTLRSPRDPDTDAESVVTVDLLQQMGFWLYGTRLGQLMANSHDPRENSKTLYSPSPIWLMGRQFKNDSVDNGHWKRCVSVGPVKRIRNISTERAELVRVSDEDYGLREGLIITPFDVELVLAQLASWLEDNRWSTVCVIEADDATLSATLESYVFSIHAIPQTGQHYVDCAIRCKRNVALQARTVFVDVLSSLMAISASHSRDSSIEFDILFVSGCSIEIGPHPNSLVLIHPGSSSPPTGPRVVLLWSEHIHDWICREIYQDPSSMMLMLRSPMTNLSPMPLDITNAHFYFFADSSLRFAISHAATWLCFRALSVADFTALLAWLPSVLHNRQTIQALSPHTPPRLPSVSPKRERSNRNTSPSCVGCMEDFLQTFESCFWFTYRRDFPRLLPSILSSDAGFGCMIRAGQSMMAEALARILLDPDRRLAQIYGSPETLAKYRRILALFLDSADPTATFSILHLTRVGVQYGTPIGQHFNPSVLSRALRTQCRLDPSIPFDVFLVKQGIIPLYRLKEAVVLRPQLILMPLRLGADTLNADYSVLIKAALSSPHSLGIIGGRSARAFYIVGYQDDALLYLDPHLLRQASTLDAMVDRRECHTRAVCELSLPQLDPTILFGFLCRTKEELTMLVTTLMGVSVPMPLFSISNDGE
ncbi:Atg4p [Paramicrosporidium saccamoebae]|uniref:Cysteine protease n=1 Tax=Paramicrosporidium saccamoebae TaxID=1246581 RepID=A0A2H9TPL7_9FUNG|nr:Atg4p [Paramicrosporidium saccamoebae]